MIPECAFLALIYLSELYIWEPVLLMTFLLGCVIDISSLRSPELNPIVSSFPSKLFFPQFTHFSQWYYHQLRLEFFFLATLWHMEFLGQKSDPSHSCDLSHTAVVMWILDPLCWARDRTSVPRAPEMPPIPLSHIRNS